MHTNCKGTEITTLDLKLSMQPDLMKSVSVEFVGETARFFDAKKKFETNFIIEILKQCRTQAEAAFKLEMTPPTFMRKLESLGINAKFYLRTT